MTDNTIVIDNSGSTTVVITFADAPVIINESTPIPTVITQLEYGPQGIPGSQGMAGAGFSNLQSFNIAPNVNTTIDILDSTQYRACKYIININILSQYRVFELLLLNQDTIDIPFSIYGILGSKINVSIDTVLLDNNINLNIINNNNIDINLTIMRVGLILK